MRKKSDFFPTVSKYKTLEKKLCEKNIFNSAIAVGKCLVEKSVLLTDLLEISNCLSSLTDRLFRVCIKQENTANAVCKPPPWATGWKLLPFQKKKCKHLPNPFFSPEELNSYCYKKEAKFHLITSFQKGTQ